MNLREALARAIRIARKNQGLSQEDFVVVSSRTYMSALERGLKSPTVDKLDQLGHAMGVSAAAVLCLAYGLLDRRNPEARIEAIAAEAARLFAEYKASPEYRRRAK
ncbi:helix-turn-helix transcriptional regulator [Niveibacterium sp. SC-1]|uniref:helix-turn-helix domain-containing protein n=1 Tax=Niveibacterium sp. SC-1 TaxID=3135646 RepID=UPI00311D72BD